MNLLTEVVAVKSEFIFSLRRARGLCFGVVRPAVCLSVNAYFA